MEKQNSEMDNFQKLFDVFKDRHDINDIQRDLNKLDILYQNQRFHDMNKHIGEVAQKHKAEAEIWNRTNTKKSKKMGDIYSSARNFLCALGCKGLVKFGVELKNYLTASELSFIEAKIKYLE